MLSIQYRQVNQMKLIKLTKERYCKEANRKLSTNRNILIIIIIFATQVFTVTGCLS